ncbi:type III pantothenate kinase [uncultured Alistipes sp.]|uniref:type III pantothenate kinase n=1 Tax=uncultured Alistipes sp. TaxID=538949 RepID=UPI00272A4822|nr:type III pantothenate kinase [uncultured Alistipes sp.]
MNLIVDIGNTRVKAAVMERGECVAQRSAGSLEPAMLDELFAAWRIDKAIVCSTRGDTADAAAMLRRRVERVVEFGPATPVPIRNDYLTPATLGRDRLAAAVGAAVLWPGRNVLIVDCGTAVTIDLVTADGTFRGGCISPGLRSRFRALHDYTAALPLCSPAEAEEETGGAAGADTGASSGRESGEEAGADTAEDGGAAAEAHSGGEPAQLLGRTTREAIERGVTNSLVYEIEGYMARLQGKIDGLCVIFTGGDAKYLSKRIKNTIFANRNPVLCGLDRILEFNVSEEHLE